MKILPTMPLTICQANDNRSIGLNDSQFSSHPLSPSPIDASCCFDPKNFTTGAALSFLKSTADWSVTSPSEVDPLFSFGATFTLVSPFKGNYFVKKNKIKMLEVTVVP